LSRHPFDWIIHGVLCFIPIAYGYWESLRVGIVITVITLFVAGMIEYEQRFSIYNANLTWKEYIEEKVLGDIVADLVGLSLGIWIGSLI